MLLLCASSAKALTGRDSFERRLTDAALVSVGTKIAELGVISLRGHASSKPANGASFVGCRGNHAVFMAEMIRAIIRLRPEIVMLENSRLVPLAIVVRCLRPHAAIVLSMHDFQWSDAKVPRAWHRCRAAIAKRFVTLVVADSHFAAATIKGEYGLAKLSFGVLRDVIDGEERPDAADRRDETSGEGRPFAVRSVIRPGGSCEGVWQAMFAAGRVAKSPAAIDYQIVGAGERVGELSALSRAVGLGAVVRFTQPSEDHSPFEAWRDADAMLLPCEREMSGITVLQAWQAGIPVICGKGGANSEFVEDGVDGLVVETRNIPAVTKAIETLMADPDLGRNLALNARQRLAVQFSQHGFAENFQSILDLAARSAPRAAAEVRRVLIYRLGSIGDFVVALPCLHAIRRRYPAARICLLTNRPAESLAAPAMSILKDTGLIDEYYTYPLFTRDPQEFAELRRLVGSFKPDLMVYLASRPTWFDVLRDYIFFRLIGVPRVIGLPFSSRLRTCRAPANDQGLWEAEADRLSRCVARLGPTRTERPESWDLCLTEVEKQTADTLLAKSIPDPFPGRCLLGICVGTKQADKDWGGENWRAVLAALKPLACGLVLIGAADERELSANVAKDWPGPVLNACGLLSPRESAALIRRTDLFLCHDSGPMHLAAAVGTRCVAVFSKHNLPGQWYPFGSHHQVLYPPPGSKSIQAITPGQVVEATFRALRENEQLGANNWSLA